MAIKCPHDKLFKQMMKDLNIAKDFFKYYLPKRILDLIDLNSLKPCPNSYINEQLESSSSDILFEVELAGQKVYLYLLCEHQSTVDNLMPLRLWEYIFEIWRDHMKKTGEDTFPLVVPLLFYHGKYPYNGPLDICEMIQAPKNIIDDILFKPFHLIDMHQIKDETLREQKWVGILSFVMKHIFERDFLPYMDSLLNMLVELEKNNGKKIIPFLKPLVLYIINSGNIGSAEILLDKINRQTSGSVKGEFMSVAEWLENRGRKEGRGEMALEMVIHLIQFKFNTLPKMYQIRLEKATPSELLFLTRRILTSKSLEELFEEELCA